MGQHLRRTLSIGALAFATAAATFTAAGPAQAIGTDWYVSTTGDDANDCATASNPCRHIGHVIDELAENNDTIHVASGTYAESEIEISVNLTIEGAAHGTTTVSQPGDAIFGVFGSEGVPTVNFTNLTISGNAEGDGVDVDTAAVNFTNSHVDGNDYYGVGAYASVIHASHSTFSGNGVADHSGDGIYLTSGAVSVDHSIVDGNFGYGIFVTPSAFAIPDGRAKAANGFDSSIRFDHSTASNNHFAGLGGYGSSIQVWSSTLSGNTGAGVENASGIAEVRNSTITGTKQWPGAAGPSAGILSATPNPLVQSPSAKVDSRMSATSPSDLNVGEVAVSGSIVAKQAPGVADCVGTAIDDGYNISSDAANSCSFSSAKHDLKKTNPRIGRLARNGGATKTHAPLKGSPVIDRIRSGRAGCVKSATDQRGKPRVQPVDGRCDIGAVELAAKPLVIRPKSLPHGRVGKKYAETIAATGGQFPSYAFEVVRGHLPKGLSLSAHGKLSGTPTKADTYTFTVRVNHAASKSYKVVIAHRT